MHMRGGVYCTIVDEMLPIWQQPLTGFWLVSLHQGMH